jgi:UDP-glucose 4-epimerase
MKILVTGGCGFIGSHVARCLVKAGHDVTAFDNLTTGKQNNLDDSCSYINGDVRDFSQLTQAMAGKEAIVHLAAYTSVPDSFDDSELCFDINVQGTLNVLEAAVEQGVTRVLFASSSAVYADEPAGQKCESMCPEPSSPYAVSKLEGEHLLQWYQQRKGLNATAFRFFNVYGPKQDATSPYAAVIPIFVRQALAGEAMTICGSGEQTRDFVHVADVAQAHLCALNTDVSGVFNVGTGLERSVVSLARMISSHMGREANFNYIEERPGDVAASTADIAAICKELGWQPSIDFEQGIEEVVDWYCNETKSGQK